MNVSILLPCIALMAAAPPVAPRELQPVRMGPAEVRSLAAGSTDGRGSCLNPITISELVPTPTEFGIAGYVIDRPGFYLVSRNLSVPAVDFGILILAENVTVDLGGHAISDVSGESTLIRLIGNPVRATVRNGRLEGGGQAIVVTREGPALSRNERSALIVEGMLVRTMNKGRAGWSIEVSDVRDVSIVSSRVTGADYGVVLTRWMRSEISDSTIIAEKTGIDSTIIVKQNLPQARGEIRGNYIRAHKALSAGFGTLIEDNTIKGAVELTSMLDRLVGNRIEAHHGNHALSVSGSSNLIERNHIDAGTEAGIHLLGEANRIASNVVMSRNVGIRVSGAHNLLEANTIGGGGLGCGLLFENDNGHAYRDNSIRVAGQAVCGDDNIDGGGNTVGPVCLQGLSSSSGLAPDGTCHDATSVGPADWTIGQGFSGYGSTQRRGPARRLMYECPPADAVQISEIAPAVTPLGYAAIVITEPGYYLVTEDLTIPRGSIGVAILAAPVTVDFGGHVISCDTFCWSMIAARGVGDVTIRNGVLLGGDRSIEVDDLSSLHIENMHVTCTSASDCRSLRAERIGHAEILNSKLLGIETSAAIVASTGRIVGNEIGALEGGLLGGFIDGEVLDNLLRGDDALTWSGNNLVAGNLIVGHGQGHALALRSGTSLVVNNSFLQGGDFGVGIGADESTFAGNLLRGVGFSLGSIRSTIINNTIVRRPPFEGPEVGITVLGVSNTIENNLIVRPVLCGIGFLNDGHNPYRDNVVLGAQEGACGVPNEDAGENVFPPSTCGNDLRGGDEVCDGYDLGGQGCVVMGYAGGNLECNESCDGFDTSGCLP